MMKNIKLYVYFVKIKIIFCKKIDFYKIYLNVKLLQLNIHLNTKFKF